MESFLQYTQMALGIIGSIISLYFQLKKPDQLTTQISYKSPQNLIDLSFILLISCLFSFLIIDSIVISGRNPSLDLTIMLQSTVLTLLITSIVLVLWYKGIGVVGVGIMALTTLVILISSPGGPFTKSGGGNEGLNLILPQFVLTILLSGSMIYVYGNPFNQNAKNKGLVTIGLMVVIGISIISTGLNFQKKDLRKDVRNPNISSNASWLFVERVKKLNDFERDDFYRLATDYSLSDYYTKQRNDVFDRLSDKSFSTDRQYPSNSREGDDANHTENDSITFENYSPPQQQYSRPEQQYSQSWSKKQQLIVDDLQKNFVDLSPNNRLNFLSLRLKTTHPTRSVHSTEPIVPLPGTSSSQRYETLSPIRVYHSLIKQPNLQQEYIQSFNSEYNDIQDLRDLFPNLDQSTYTYREPELVFQRIKTLQALRDIKNLYEASLLEGLAAYYVTKQSALPNRYESFLTHQAYITFLISSQSGQNTPYSKIIDFYYGSLDESHRRSVYYFILNSPERNERFDLLKKLRTIDFSELRGDIKDQFRSGLVRLRDGEKLKDSTKMGELLAYIDQAITHDATYDEARKRYLTLENLLNDFAPSVNLFDLFDKKTQKFLDIVDSASKKLKTEDFEKIFDYLRSPGIVALTNISEMYTQSQKDTSGVRIDKMFFDFRSRLTHDEQESVLHYLAINLYKAEGPYSLAPFALLISKANFINAIWGDIFSSIIWLPLFLVALLIGGFFAQKLVSRDYMVKAFSNEKNDSLEFESNAPTPFKFREEMFRKIDILAGKGWSTIALVGRRGVGKSRALSELITREKSKIKVWISAPTKFSESDFIVTVLERIAFKTEAEIASVLEAKPLSVRRIESSLSRTGVFLYLAAITTLLFILASIGARINQDNILILWIPVLIVLILSILLLIAHFTQLQPVDLSGWLNKDKNNNPHTLFLYKETTDVIRFLNRKYSETLSGANSTKSTFKVIKSTLLWVCMILFALMLIKVYMGGPFGKIASEDVFIMFGIAFAALFIYQVKPSEDKREFGESLMSLINVYRNYVTAIVKRQHAGALSKENNSKQALDRKQSAGSSKVIICVDELDKIIDASETHEVIRKIKSIFEISGVHYYLSISEDSLEELYNISKAKTEIDSSFDHIIRVSPLSLSEGRNICEQYLNSRISNMASSGSSKSVEPSISLFISTVSFGIARDIFRRADEILASSDNFLKASDAMSTFRNFEYKILLSSGIIDSTWWSVLGLDTIDALNFIKNRVRNEEIMNAFHEEQKKSVILMYLIVIIEACIITNKPETYLEKIHEIGYRIPLARFNTLSKDLETLDVDEIR